MAAGGVQFQTDNPPPPIAPTNLFGNPATFTAAANTQASDYDRIMQEYSDLAKSSILNPIVAGRAVGSGLSTPQVQNFSPVQTQNVTPQTVNYQQSGDVTSSLGKLSDLATTGGYDAQGIADLRARGIAPTRSIYANAQQNVERQRALSGGYSPNFNAVQAQLARDESSQIGDITTNVNAGIAQNVASNRIAAAPAYASAAASANAEQLAADQANAAIVNQINEANAARATQVGEFNTQGALQAGEFNAGMAADIGKFNVSTGMGLSEFNTQEALQAALANRQSQLGAIEGQRNLYGTTPALTATFGNQVVQANQANNQTAATQRQNVAPIFQAARAG